MKHILLTFMECMELDVSCMNIIVLENTSTATSNGRKVVAYSVHFPTVGESNFDEHMVVVRWGATFLKYLRLNFVPIPQTLTF